MAQTDEGDGVLGSAEKLRNNRGNHPETKRGHTGAQQCSPTGGSTMLTTAVLHRLAVTLFVVATVSAPALLIA